MPATADKPLRTFRLLWLAFVTMLASACAEESMSDCALREMASWEPEKVVVEENGEFFTTEGWNCGLKIAMWLCDEDVDLTGCEANPDTGAP